MKLAFDVEIYPNFFLIMFKSRETGKVVIFKKGLGEEIDVKRLWAIMNNHELISFNGINFDVPLIALALADKPLETIFKGCEAIIKRGLKPWQFEKEFKIKLPELNHVDLMEIAIGRAGLKLYGARMHTLDLENSPLEPGKDVTYEESLKLTSYCEKDLNLTLELYKELEPQIKLREHLTSLYGFDMRSKSDAQIGESILVKSVEIAKGERLGVVKLEVEPYIKPSFIKFKSKELNAVADDVYGILNEFNDPSNLKLIEVYRSKIKQKVEIAGNVYTFGIGGLHSNESKLTLKASKRMRLIDRDVTSYYPSIIINQRLAPQLLAPEFNAVYESVVSYRIKAKKRGDKVTADAYKIAINGSYGKFGSIYSKLYSPNLMLQTTITGQLSLLMLIESLELAGISVKSANTDGVLLYFDKSLNEAYNDVIHDWESRTHFETEETIYDSYYARDVNNYFAMKPDGTTKGKGVFSKGGLSKNPDKEIIIDAAIDYLTIGVPVEQTINSCDDIRKFLTVRQVAGGATYGDDDLGKVTRFYHCGGESCLTYKINGHKVPTSDGCRPIMKLPKTLPTDIDYQYYINTANKLIGLVC